MEGMKGDSVELETFELQTEERADFLSILFYKFMHICLYVHAHTHFLLKSISWHFH